MTIDLDEVIGSYGDDDPARYHAIADHFLKLDDRAAAATALDRAYGLRPDDAALARHRAAILDELAVHEHGITWRYIPAGTFLMGSTTGDPDERPVHPRRVEAFWIADVPHTLAQYHVLAGWSPPPSTGAEAADAVIVPSVNFMAAEMYAWRLAYCDDTVDSVPESYRQFAGPFVTKPAVVIPAIEAEQVAARISTATVRYALPTEAQWEKAARGGLVGKRYAWGDEPPNPATCDFDRMDEVRIGRTRALPPNGYGLHGTCGGVSEWTADRYDALAYHHAAGGAVAAGDSRERVLRGGSWADCAQAVTVSHRTSQPTQLLSPTIGVRFVRSRVLG